MKNASQIKDAIHDLREEMDAIIAVSDREERELNEDESTRCADISEKLIPALSKQMRTALAIDKERQARSASRFDELLASQQAESGTLDTSTQAVNRLQGIKIPAKARAHGILNAYRGPDAERDAYIAGNVILAGVYGNQAAAAWCHQRGLQVNASLTTTNNTAGGFLVPEEMNSTLIRLREERGVFPQFANRIPMGADIMRVPRLLSDVTAYWTGEGVDITASDPVIGEAELMARKLAALTKVSSELDEDAVVMVGDMVTQSMAYAMADKIDLAAFLGDGTSTYGGVLGLKNALDSSAQIGSLTGNDAANNQDLDDFEKVLGSYPQYAGASPRWFMHSAVYYAACVRLMAAAGGNSITTLENGATTQMFMGYPVTFVQVMPSTITTLASTIIAYFGDLRLGCSYGTRRSTRTEVSTERYFESDLIGIKCTERIAINVHERGDSIRNRPILAMKTAA
tara:strand:+ start:758 stop:2128 length:1371 start_codon:yes stop_codon:yes gene_type:complete